ncbi:hypothetical protein FA15DRAFT_687684 [Coprinopsis marcescibilis]|uniref:Calcineurin-like phosphoesterase domain-containing protein n=1 Tax=Coprinopsis marcescibilis TaxID=230819 RepID=A0A5C3KTJ0_COPMA|nr:hypothetical protein FA15DRAFT_687684 [Coprinopsis marcescibilis]
MKKSKPQLTGRSGGQSNLYSPVLRKYVLQVLGIIAIIWGEIGVFYWSLRDCRWPTLERATEGGSKVAHVLLLTDTQMKHHFLQSPGEAWTTALHRFFYHLNLKKSWHVATRLNPDVVVFLGDMLANGKNANNGAIYSKVAEAFKHLFSTKNKLATYYLPGNNDISMGEITPVATRVRKYFTESFGPVSQSFEIQNHTFVALDAPGLVDEDYQRAARGTAFGKWKPIPDGPIAFVNEIAGDRKKEDKFQNPVVLLSHIPLARPEMADCGPLREKGTIRRDVGHGYQSMLGRQTTTYLLNKLQPVAVFSGDNRDYCEYTHTIPHDEHSIREVTVKSFSVSVHIRRPGFQLLSIMDPSLRAFPLDNTISDKPCFLPDQTRIYTTFYLPLFCLTLFVLFLFNFNSRRSKGYRSLPWKPPPIRVGSSSTSSSGQSSPVRQRPSNVLSLSNPLAWTPTWSPFSPNTPQSNYHNNLPGNLRTPHSANVFSGPTLRASSRPGTPGLGPTLPGSPFLYAGGPLDDEDEDPMQPSQYAILRRETSQRRYEDHDEEWSDVGQAQSNRTSSNDEDGFDLVNKEDDSSGTSLLPITTNAAHQKHNRKFSEFISAPDAGKRGANAGRSWTFSPSMAGFKNLLGLLGIKTSEESMHGRPGVCASTAGDMLSVSWPAFITWCIIVWRLS